MECPQCHFENSPDSKFCKECGTQVKPEKEADQRSDIYSLEVILYGMVTGRVPFEADTPFALGLKHKSEIPRDPRGLNSQIPEELSRLILKCLEKDKEKGYQTTAEIYSDLSGIEKGVPTAGRALPKRKPFTSKEMTVTFGLKKLLIPALVVIFLALAAAVIWQISLKKGAGPITSAKKSMAVLPFVDLSPAKDHEYLGEGISDTLINALTNIEGLWVYTALGEKEAFACLEKAFREHDSNLIAYLRTDPGFDPVRSDPRFTALWRRIGLEK